MSSTDAAELQIRQAEPDDVPAVAALYREARLAAVPLMPPALHTAEEDRSWLEARLGEGHEAWLVEQDEELLGYAVVTDVWLDHLYVRPGRTGQGIGTLLLETVKALRPAGFGLWVFESNTPARRFYQARGLVALERTDGSGNEEGSPDVRMVWPGLEPLAFLRRQIDEVDDRLAELLARRAALTAAVQAVKAVPGHPGRDPGREAEIVERMMRHAPDLGREGLSRIMHEIISVSLDAAGRAEGAS